MPNEILDVAKNLRTLDLSTNRIVQIPSNLFQSLVIVKTINLENNKIGIIDKLI